MVLVAGLPIIRLPPDRERSLCHAFNNPGYRNQDLVHSIQQQVKYITKGGIAGFISNVYRDMFFQYRHEILTSCQAYNIKQQY